MIGGPALRAALFTALLLVLGVLARPAQAASAPFCDDRGATSLAPAPALHASGEAITAYRARPCRLGDLSPLSTVSPSHRRVASSAHAWDAALAPPPVTPPAPAAARIDWPARDAPRGSDVHPRLERPPRH